MVFRACSAICAAAFGLHVHFAYGAELIKGGEIHVEPMQVTGVAFDRSHGLLLVAGTDSTRAGPASIVRIYDRALKRLLVERRLDRSEGTSVAISDDGKYVLVITVWGEPAASTVRVYDDIIRSGEAAASTVLPPDEHPLEWCGTEKSDPIVAKFEVRTGTIGIDDVRQRRRLFAIDPAAKATLFSAFAVAPRSTFVAWGHHHLTRDDFGFTIWSRKSQESREVRAPGRGNVTALAFSPDETQIAIGTSAGETAIWNIQGGNIQFEGEIKYSSEVQSARVGKVAFSPNGKRIAAQVGRALVISDSYLKTSPDRADVLRINTNDFAWLSDTGLIIAPIDASGDSHTVQTWRVSE
jgi:hypothetical protein